MSSRFTAGVLAVFLFSCEAGAVPTASQLSLPGELNNYLETELQDSDRTGPVWLPKGVITTADTMVLERISGVAVAGHSPHGFATGSSSPYATGTHNGRPAAQGTKILYTGPASEPAVSIRGAHGITLRGVHIEHANGGVGIQVTNSNQYFTSHVTFDNLVVSGCSRAFDFLRGTGFLQSDCDFRKVVVRDCTECAMRSRANQQVIFNWYGGCYVYDTPTAFLFHPLPGETAPSGGGNLTCTGVSTRNVQTGVDILGGGNTAPIVLTNFTMDPGVGPLPVVVRVLQGMSVSWSGKVVPKGGDDISAGTPSAADDHYFFSIQKKWSQWASRVYVGANNLHVFDPTGLMPNAAYRVLQTDSSGNRVDYIEQSNPAVRPEYAVTTL